MEHYVTLFDSKYMPQGLSLHTSLQRFGGDYTLWILCIDQNCYEVFKALDLPRVNLLNLTNHETPELLDVKRTRTIGEYCWTLTPFAFSFVFGANKEIERLTYIDSDVWFRKSPSIIFDEFNQSKKSILITDHGYAPENDFSAYSGQYCVQFLIFDRFSSQEVLREWQDQCLEWCFNRSEDGKFGDQKYLDNWPVKYSSLVHVLQREHLTLAPWNASRFPYSNSVLWHFHGLKLHLNPESNLMNINLCDDYPLLEVVKKNVYFPYVRDLANAIKAIRVVGKLS